MSEQSSGRDPVDLHFQEARPDSSEAGALIQRLLGELEARREKDNYEISQRLKKLIYWLIVIAGVLFSLLVLAFLVHLIFPLTRDALFGASIAQVNKILGAAISVLIGGIIGTFVGRFLR